MLNAIDDDDDDDDRAPVSASRQVSGKLLSYLCEYRISIGNSGDRQECNVIQ